MRLWFALIGVVGALALYGCGYSGALYRPQPTEKTAPPHNTPSAY